jgi:hypothetical protein
MGSPPPPGYRVTSLTLPPDLADYVDSQSKRYGISKAGFVRLVLTRTHEAEAAAKQSALSPSGFMG